MSYRRDTINAVLLALVCERIKHECGKMLAAGADIEQVNSAVPDMVTYYTCWQEETLDRVMREFDDMERPHSADDGTSLRPH